MLLACMKSCNASSKCLYNTCAALADVKLCTEIGKYALLDQSKPIENICISLSTASKLLGGLPTNYPFFELFSEILRKSDGKMDALEKGYDFFVSVFKNAAFFNSFFRLAP